MRVWFVRRRGSSEQILSACAVCIDGAIIQPQYPTGTLFRGERLAYTLRPFNENRGQTGQEFVEFITAILTSLNACHDRASDGPTAREIAQYIKLRRLSASVMFDGHESMRCLLLAPLVGD